VRKLFLAIIFLFLSSTPVYASRSISISSDKSALFGDEEMAVTASASGFATSEAIFVKGAFYQDGSTNYFGYTKNGDSWVKNGESTQNQYQIKTDNWDGTIHIKCDFGDSGYKGEGDYKFKIGFYYTTSNGSFSSVNWSSNVLTVSISEPDPIPTDTPSPTPVKTATPTPTSSPTSSPTRSPIPKPTPTPKLSPTPLISSESGQILGLESSNSAQTIDTNLASPTPVPKTLSFDKNLILPATLIFSGVSLIVVAIYNVFCERRKDFKTN